jgi:hypothetical protein
MKEQELDRYVGCIVIITDFEKEKNCGLLYKIKDGIVYRNGQKEFHSISNGYFLEGKNIDYRKSHIKKIEIV